MIDLNHLKSQMAERMNRPCPSYVRRLIEAANEARIGFSDLEDLRHFLALYPRCGDFVNDLGDKVLMGEIDSDSLL